MFFVHFCIVFLQLSFKHGRPTTDATDKKLLGVGRHTIGGRSSSQNSRHIFFVGRVGRRSIIPFLGPYARGRPLISLLVWARGVGPRRSFVGRRSFFIQTPVFCSFVFQPIVGCFISNFQAQTVVLGLLVWAMCIYSSLFYLALHLLISFKPALGWLLLSPFFHVLPAFLQLLMF